MSQSALSVVPQTYGELRRAVEAAMITGQLAADLAKVRTYHLTGQVIYEHVLLFKDRADYGAKTIPRLAADLKLDRSVLLRCVQFFRSFPNVATWRQLTWGHYRTLIPVADPKLRQSLAGEANKNSWSVIQLEQRVRILLPLESATDESRSGTGAAQKLLTPKRGTAGICKVIAVEGAPVVDLGFASYLDLPEDTDLQAGDFVQLHGADRITAAAEATKAELFTYTAVILKVVDGDTLWVKIYLRPKHWVKQKLRFRDLDCPEMSTPEGKVAKRFVDALVARTTSVTICTTKPDKYDRYLADVFLTLDDGTEIFLNNELLTNGQAVIKRAWEFGDWGEV